MLDVIHLLRREHRTLQILFEEYMTAGDRPTLAAEACTELLLHLAGEEEVLYPVVERELQGGHLLVRDALEEHRELTEAIADLDRMGYDHPDALEAMRHIIEVATEHIDEEEKGLLFDLKVVLTLEELEALGDDLADARAEREAYLRMELTEPGPEPAEAPLEPPAPVDAEGEEPELVEVDLTDLTRRELYQMAAEEGIAGRSRMSRAELIEALAAH